MQFNINRPPKKVRQREKKRAKRKALAEWHGKFAWLPTVVDETEETYRRVWFEGYMRQQRIGPTNSTFDDGRYFVKHSRKEYFTKKLNGDFDKGDEDVQEDTGRVASTSVSRASVNYGVLKKGGQMSAFKKNQRQLL